MKTDLDRFERFCDQYVVQTKGRWAGQPLALEPWERDVMRELFLLDSNNDPIYHEALIGLPRKNGKSTLASSIALFKLLAANENSPEVYAAAAAKDQAGIVFGQAKKFVEASPALRDWLTPRRGYIECPHNDGIFRVLSADAPLQHGLNPSCVIIDELWAHKSRDLYDALTTADIAREHPLIVSITTAGFDRESVLWEVYEQSLEYKTTQQMRDDRFYFKWFAAPDGCDLDDRAAWAVANPSSWVTEERMERKMRKLPEFVFRRLYLNQWTETEEAWIGADDWDACADASRSWDPDAPTWMAVDVGIKRDSSAIVLVQWHGEQLHARQIILTPEDDPTLGVEDVREAIGEEAGLHSALKEIDFDPYSFQESAEELSNRGLNMVEFPQTSSRMGPASEMVYELIKEHRLVHDGDSTFRSQVLAAVPGPTERGWRISKRKSRRRIDAAIALACAADVAIAQKNKKRRKRSVTVF